MDNIEHFSDKAYRIATTIIIKLLKYQSYLPKSNTAANKKICFCLVSIIPLEQMTNISYKSRLI